VRYSAFDFIGGYGRGTRDLVRSGLPEGGRCVAGSFPNPSGVPPPEEDADRGSADRRKDCNQPFHGSPFVAMKLSPFGTGEIVLFG
jgi:hypothetical protein